MMGWPLYNGMGWLGIGLGILFMIIVWAGIIALIAWIVIKYARSGQKSSSETPLDIAKARYAKGEISKKEFEQIKKDLGQ